MPKNQSTVEILERKPLRHGYAFEPDPTGYIEVPSVTVGMMVEVPRERVAKGSVELALNAVIDDGALRRRDGTAQYGSDVEDEKILNLIPYSTDIASFIIRCTKGGIYVDEGNASWTQYVTRAFKRRFSFAPFVDDLYLTNGEQPVRQMDFVAKTAEPITGAPVARYITNFADRIIAANVSGEPYKIIWPVNGDPTDWTGIGSGEANLVSGVSDLSDDITGIFGGEREMIILRKHSIWIASRLPSADAPLKFEPVFTGFGCDMPYTAVKVPGGVVFGNRDRVALYYFQLGRAPVELNSDRVPHHMLAEGEFDASFTQAAYDETHDNYHIGSAYDVGEPNMRETWVVNLQYRTWVQHDSPEYTAIGWAPLSNAALYIDDLVGTIDAQVGHIHDLVNTVDQELDRARIFKGISEKVFYHLEGELTDYDGGSFFYRIISPNLGALHARMTLQDVGLSLKSENGCTITIEASTDKETWRNPITQTVLASNSLQSIHYRRQRVTGDNLYFRVTSSDGDFRLFSYWVRALQKGQHR